MAACNPCSCAPLAAAAVGAAAYALLVDAGIGTSLLRAVLPRQAFLLLIVISSFVRAGARAVIGRVQGALAAWHEPPLVAAANPADAPAPNVVMRRPRMLPAVGALPPSLLTPLTFGSAVPDIATTTTAGDGDRVSTLPPTTVAAAKVPAALKQDAKED